MKSNLQTCHEETNYNLLMIFRSEWTKLKYTLNLVRCFLLHSTMFQYFFMDSKVNCRTHMINDMFKNVWKEYFKGMLLIWKKYFTRAILSFSIPRCVTNVRLNVIYTKFRRTMIAQLNKILCVCTVCVWCSHS